METKRERLARIIDLAIEDALSLGTNLDEFMAAAQKRVDERRRMLSSVLVAFIECNREQLDYFSKEIRAWQGVRVEPVLIDGPPCRR
jgi:GntR family transcriptional regulator